MGDGELQVDDLFVGHDGNWVPVQDLLDTGEYETVYNLRITDYHTYFVGCRDWGFSVWAHNTNDCGFVAFRSLAGDALKQNEALLQEAWQFVLRGDKIGFEAVLASKGSTAAEIKSIIDEIQLNDNILLAVGKPREIYPTSGFLVYKEPKIF